MINMFETPDVRDVAWTWATLRPGDCVLIPAGTSGVTWRDVTSRDVDVGDAASPYPQVRGACVT